MGRSFENRKHSMAARSDRMAKAFSRVSKDIAIAVKGGGPSPEGNPALRRAIQNARAVNMPKDKVEAAIKRATGVDATGYEELVYEGYGPHGVAMVVETATDNPTRTVANVRMHFTKGGGNLGTSGSVGFLFKRMGVIRLRAEGIDKDELELELIDHGLEDTDTDTDENGVELLILRSSFNDFGRLQSAVEAKNIEIVSAEPEYLPNTFAELSTEQIDDVLKLIDRLEGDDDVQKVYHTLP
ncbi:MAG TPA: YebC/PmpR family DNA-binding transcriptional regulator [Myxococcota bacterium]|nr:YebC/PmpR family DNA-binding transcriptional regulator [Myxococcota bacterium]